MIINYILRLPGFILLKLLLRSKHKYSLKDFLTGKSEAMTGETWIGLIFWIVLIGLIIYFS